MSLQTLVEARWFQNFIIVVIVFNGVVLGVQTSRSLSPETVHLLDRLDQICLAIFVIELLLKLWVYRTRFFKEGWNVFDFVW